MPIGAVKRVSPIDFSDIGTLLDPWQRTNPHQGKENAERQINDLPGLYAAIQWGKTGRSGLSDLPAPMLVLRIA